MPLPFDKHLINLIECLRAIAISCMACSGALRKRWCSALGSGVISRVLTYFCTAAIPGLNPTCLKVIAAAHGGAIAASCGER